MLTIQSLTNVCLLMLIATGLTEAVQPGDSFLKQTGVAINNFNNKRLNDVSLDHCLTACQQETTFCCRSAEYQRTGTVCFLSDVWSGTKRLSSWPLLDFYDRIDRVCECGSNPCQNGATCTGSADGVNQYTCSCAAGFIGVNCENVDECASNPCQNGATCTDEVNQYTCTCTYRFDGVNCEHRGWCPAGLAYNDGAAEYSKKRAESDGGSILAEETSSDVGDCLEFCLGFINCLSFYYNNFNQTCMVHSTPQPAWILSEEDGWEMYVRSD